MTKHLLAFAAMSLVGTGVTLAVDAPDGSPYRAAALSQPPRLVFSLTGSSVALTGDVASSSHAEVLSRLAAEHFPGKTIDSRLEAAAIADVDWQVLTLSAVFVLAETTAGRLVLEPGSLKLNAVVEGGSELLDTRVARVEAAAGPGFASQVSLHDLDRSLTTTRACSRMFKALGKDGIRFPFGTTDLNASAHAVLDRYAEFALDCPESRLSISGHTDNWGDEALNLYLSDQRAQAVREYLIAAGIDPDRVTAAGKGSAEPIADNATSWGRSRNRRIEVELLL